jgi:dethiobiotin synthetase
VGKTVVSAALIRRYADRALKYWKPIQTGIEQDDDSAEVQRLGGIGRARVLSDGIRLPRPVSPHLAAKLSGSSISISALTSLARSIADGRWIVEGAGGVLVPLNDRELLIDLVVALRLPVVIVARSGLGTINHTLMTIEVLGRRHVPLAGVVMVGAPDAENRSAIEHYGGVPVLGELPVMNPLTADRLQAWANASLDAGGQLAEFLV